MYIYVTSSLPSIKGTFPSVNRDFYRIGTSSLYHNFCLGEFSSIHDFSLKEVLLFCTSL